MRIQKKSKRSRKRYRTPLWSGAMVWLLACMLLTGGTLPVAAVDTSQSYAFDVRVNGEAQAVVEPGETVEVTLSLSRTDASGPMTIYAMTSVLRINTSLMELKDLTTGSGISSTVTERSGSLEGWSDVTLNYLSPSMDGTEWDNGCTLVTLTLQATGYGSSMIQVRRGNVSTYSGMDSFDSTLGSAVVAVQKKQEPSQPTNPAEPSEPSGPSTPSQPVDPAQPSEPSSPSSPSGPSQPTGPAEPSEPSGPSTPSQPVDPAQPSEPSTPSQPSGPANPSEPTEPAPSAPVTPVFTDVPPDAWFAEAVRYVADRNLFQGTGGGKFAPDSAMTRAMFVTVLGRAAGVEAAENARSSFTDVADGQWYTPYVDWANENGIVLGYDSETFGAADPVTREQMAAILYRYAKYRGENVTTVDVTKFRAFTDADQVSDYAKAPMTWATDKGMINGMGDGSLAPQRTSTRAEVAQVIMNFDKMTNR